MRGGTSAIMPTHTPTTHAPITRVPIHAYTAQPLTHAYTYLAVNIPAHLPISLSVQFEATVSQSIVPSSPLTGALRARRLAEDEIRHDGGRHAGGKY